MPDKEQRSQVAIPRRKDGDYTREAAAERRAFLAERAGAKLGHVAAYSFDPALLPGNVENFIGVAQVPIGLAGPLRIDGEHAKGDFYVPMATTEGTLGRQLQSRHAAAIGMRRRQDDRGCTRHAALAGVHLRQTPGRRAPLANGWRRTLPRSAPLPKQRPASASSTISFSSPLVRPGICALTISLATPRART